MLRDFSGLLAGVGVSFVGIGAGAGAVAGIRFLGLGLGLGVGCSILLTEDGVVSMLSSYCLDIFLDIFSESQINCCFLITVLKSNDVQIILMSKCLLLGSHSNAEVSS